MTASREAVFEKVLRRLPLPDRAAFRQEYGAAWRDEDDRAVVHPRSTGVQMKVHELINELETQSQEAEVVIACEHDSGTDRFSHALVYVSQFIYKGSGFVKFTQSHRQLVDDVER